MFTACATFCSMWCKKIFWNGALKFRKKCGHVERWESIWWQKEAGIDCQYNWEIKWKIGERSWCCECVTLGEGQCWLFKAVHEVDSTITREDLAHSEQLDLRTLSRISPSGVNLISLYLSAAACFQCYSPLHKSCLGLKPDLARLPTLNVYFWKHFQGEKKKKK